MIEHHHERAQRIAMRDDKDAFAAQDAGQDLLAIIWNDAGNCILQALAAWWAHAIGAPPKQNLLFAPPRPRLVFVETAEIAIVALVQGFVADRRQILMPKFGEDEFQRVLRADKIGREGVIKQKPLRLQRVAAGMRLSDPNVREIGVFPSGEEIFEVPFALAVPHENEKALHESSFVNANLGGRRKTEHVGHRIKARLLVAAPECGM